MPRRKLERPNYRIRRRGEWYYVDWTDPATGKGRSVSTRQTERDAAEIWRDQWIAGREQPAPPRQPLIAEILDGFVAARTPKVESPATLKLAAETIKHLVGNLEPRMLATGMFMDRRRMVAIPAKAGKAMPGRSGRPRRAKVSDGTIRREGGVLRAALSWAVRENWITETPHVDLPPVPPPRDRWLTKEEVARLIKGCEAVHIELFVTLAYYTAARRGAILDLTWDRVDLDCGLIHYAAPGKRATMKRRVTVPAHPAALSLLRKAREGAVTDFVIEFRGRKVADVKTAFTAACRRAGIAECTPHILRHTAATHMVMAGVPIGEVARMLGDTVAMIERTYGKHDPSYLRGASAALTLA